MSRSTAQVYVQNSLNLNAFRVVSEPQRVQISEKPAQHVSQGGDRARLL